MSKTCSKCTKSKSSDDFYTVKRHKDGLDSYCKDCRKDYNKTHRPTTKKTKQYVTKWLVKNRPVQRVLNTIWRRLNPKSWKKYESGRHRRRARLAKLPSIPYTRKEIYIRDKGICWLCGKKVLWENYHVDHKIPIIERGPDVPENVAVSHSWCNLTRKKRGYVPTLEAW